MLVNINARTEVQNRDRLHIDVGQYFRITQKYQRIPTTTNLIEPFLWTD